jgi:ADP-ribosylglycohydrolase
LALGDALGMPVEFKSIENIRETYGGNGIQDLNENSPWTDDTEMTMAVTRALMRLGSADDIKKLDPEIIGHTFAEEFIDWLENPGYAPGITSSNAVILLKKKGPDQWRFSGNNDSKGCGTVMRAAPLGVWFAPALISEIASTSGPYHELLFNVSKIQSEITHGHKAATAAALAGSYAVTLALNGISPDKMVRSIEKYCNPLHSDFESAMVRLKTSLAKRESGMFRTDLDALDHIGQGWVGDEAFTMALYAAIRYPNDLKTCLRVSVNHSGDSDSVACIAGSILGALHGMSIIPEEWINCLAERVRMKVLISRVVDFLNH